MHNVWCGRQWGPSTRGSGGRCEVLWWHGSCLQLVTHMGDGVGNNGGDSESSSNTVGRRPVIMVRNL